MEVNIRALRARAPEKLTRYDEVARLLTGRPHATAPDGVAWIAALCQKLEIPPLRTYGVAESDLAVLVEKAAQASSMKGNPIVLTEEELREIVSRALIFSPPPICAPCRDKLAKEKYRVATQAWISRFRRPPPPVKAKLVSQFTQKQIDLRAGVGTF